MVLSELGDDWGPVIRLALWTRDRRPFRTRGWRIASERLLRDPCSVWGVLCGCCIPQWQVTSAAAGGREGSPLVHTQQCPQLAWCMHWARHTEPGVVWHLLPSLCLCCDISTESSENLLSHSTQSLQRPTSHTKDDTGKWLFPNCCGLSQLSVGNCVIFASYPANNHWEWLHISTSTSCTTALTPFSPH